MVTVLTKAGSSNGVMSVAGANGRRVTMHSTPAEFDYEHVPNFGSVKRDGKPDITRVADPGLRDLSFSHMIASPDYRYTIEPTIIALQKLVRKGGKVRFTGGSPFFTGTTWYYVTGFKIKAEQLSLGNNISRATVSWTIKEAHDVSATVAKKKAAPKKTVKAAPKKTVSRTHRVRKGDTLWALSAKYLGRATRWPEIFRANKGSGKHQIKNPNLIYPGQVFKIPKR